jgi:hypothetical protein
VQFDALDNQPVKLVMLFLVPQGQFQKHLHTLANIAKLLHNKDFRQALETAPDAAAMMRIIKIRRGLFDYSADRRFSDSPSTGSLNEINDRTQHGIKLSVCLFLALAVSSRCAT